MVTLLENPLRVGLRKERVPEPQILVIFGASGDLTQRKLVPAIYQMKRDRRLPPETTVVGVARRPWSHDYFREQCAKALKNLAAALAMKNFGKISLKVCTIGRATLTTRKAIKNSKLS